MFGYVVANVDKLTAEEKQHYRSCYCGLCKALGSRHGALSRITLTYDMTFLVLFLSALYKTVNKIETERCIIHPLKPHQYWQNDITNYAADMNVVLAYYNLLDDWIDDKNILSLCEAKLFEQQYRQIIKRYPNQCTVISECLNELSKVEKSGELNADIPANFFGKLMGEIFVLREDEYTENLRAFGRALGKFIYIMDACLDLKDDIKHERYNPLIMSSSEDFSSILTLLMADCTEKYKQLPIKQDTNLIENILYSGVWTKYEAEKQKQRRQNKQ
ncbi:DUF5685 family protein [Acetivibrio cellulolyticus]|uniref:DUF5685 family protein n=1 Tax=Acetivibrio cellulolyticus TaxID=35830 RepID=UPI0001E2BDE7|nr:DUF5685 family protein [Acetivibrio cellulolyticus]